MASVVDMLGGSLLGSIKDIIGSFKEDPTKKAELQSLIDQHEADFKLAELQINSKIEDHINSEVLAQIEVNKADALSSNWYQAGWRPSAGYACVLGLVYQFLFQPIFTFISLMFHGPIAPAIETSTLIALLTALLGLGSLRTTEKLKDRDKDPVG